MGFRLKSAPRIKSPMEGSGVSVFGIRKVVLQYWQVIISDRFAWGDMTAPQFGQFKESNMSPQGVGVSVGVSLGNGVSVGMSVGMITTGVSVGEGNGVIVAGGGGGGAMARVKCTNFS